MIDWCFNTSNAGKRLELQQLFAAQGYSLHFSALDLPEIDADPLTVVVHKASQLPEITIVDDTSLEVAGEKVGIHVRWLLAHLDQYLGKEALWRVLLAYRQGNQVFVFEGSMPGLLVPRRGESGFGFDPYFLPNGGQKTLAEFKPTVGSARSLAVNSLLAQKPFATTAPIYSWDGPWQSTL